MTHPFTTDEADYRRLCKAVERALRFWHSYCFDTGKNYAELGVAMQALSEALDPITARLPTRPPLIPAVVNPGRRVLIDGRECTLVELEDGR